jgi:hypothetical protein
MKVLLISFLILCFAHIKAQEISLFNSKGTPIAYVDTDDDDLPIYLWIGHPVAYISGDNIYGFNGKHLGWWIKGIIRDHDGDVIGATKDAINMYTEYEPYKGYKEYKPYKSYKEYAPYKPYWSTTWASGSLKMFLLQGIAD